MVPDTLVGSATQDTVVPQQWQHTGGMARSPAGHRQHPSPATRGPTAPSQQRR